MSQASEVENQLRKLILNMELGPGERLTERWAEATFNASRTPVRAALQKLESEGLVCRDGLRWLVAPIDVSEVEQLCIYREVLEVAALKLSASQMTEEQLNGLENLLKTNTVDASEDVMDDVGTQFHLQLAGLCQNAFIFQGISDALRRLSRARWLDKAPSNPAWDDHREIIAALRSRDTDKAAELLAIHLCESRLRLLEAINSSRRSLRARGIAIS
ncbi:MULTISPECIES: GntR family transcriptional regulator [Klebsiella]|jgi:DNA-binding GntR family transcriptional regulator|uniref:GntR family transcriptional regulator n=1 Tax=Klebsiella TaxID=570 RepID=UPI0004710196|nr:MULTISPECIES: GntR family transcriptional regulator [Klebsiella]MEA1148804.1 GntR family transcriptional regulator [Klebsiella pneumoniae]ASV20258.1 GntR family transcriptional regulator [Klebsiella quasivariicola]MBF7818218.1 GntR family transcriptional regulator [Klebsiella quasivariicola]MCJ1826669.1 GntR family transcriptional regulator [Klebsiella quasivariicola]UDC36924.1 GntR family transcriptional regulator [Klebsiella quasivariicola]